MVCKFSLSFQTWLLNLVDCFLCSTEVFQFEVVPFIYFLILLLVLLVSYPWNYYQDKWHEDFPLCFPLGVLQFWVFKSFNSFWVYKHPIHLSLFLSIFFLNVDIQFSQHHLLKGLSFPHCAFLASSLRSVDCIYVDLLLDSLCCSIDRHVCLHGSTMLLYWL